MMTALAVVLAVLLALFLYAGRAAFAVLVQLTGNVGVIGLCLREWLDGGSTESEKRFRDLEDLVDRLPSRWEEIKRETARLDSRARYAAKSARDELAARGLEDDRLEELATELQLGDAETGGEEQLQLVSESVAQDESAEDWRAAVARLIG